MNSLARLIIIALIVNAIGLYSDFAQAETMYVTDVLRVTVREGSGSDYKIIDVIESGQEVQVISSFDQWAKVRLPDGREGWVVAKYLTPNKSGSGDFKQLKEKESLLDARNSALQRENDQLRDEIKNVGLQLAETKQNLCLTNKLFETLKANPETYIDLEAKYREAEKKLSLQKSKMENLEDEITRLTRQQNVIWLLSGAGILLIGFLIGYNARREKSRSSLL
jgi:SH3 domain protein